MTEERMIRISDLPEHNLKFAEARIYYSNDGTVQNKDMMVETIAINEFMEPAPPKDWRPACYNYSELVGGCAQIPFTDKPQCKECPFRNME